MENLSSFKALILGVIQGITEFLPISSSAHLLLFSNLLNEGKPLPLFYNVALHFGTALAILFYFRKDWVKMLKSLKSYPSQNKNQKLLFNLIIGSIPAAVIGLSLKDFIEATFHNTLSIILPLGIVGILLWLTDYLHRGRKDLYKLTGLQALLIGLGQTCALIPGVSRSASTIIACRLLNLTKMDAARFSFLLGTPVMMGAALLHVKDFYLNLNNPGLYVGFFSSFFVGLASIHFFLKLISRFGFFAFALYRVALSLLLSKLYLF